MRLRYGDTSQVSPDVLACASTFNKCLHQTEGTAWPSWCPCAQYMPSNEACIRQVPAIQFMILTLSLPYTARHVESYLHRALYYTVMQLRLWHQTQGHIHSKGIAAGDKFPRSDCRKSAEEKSNLMQGHSWEAVMSRKCCTCRADLTALTDFMTGW